MIAKVYVTHLKGTSCPFFLISVIYCYNKHSSVNFSVKIGKNDKRNC